MSQHAKYVPKHRNVPEQTLRDAPKKALRTGVLLTSVAVAVTGIAVSGGVLGSGAGQVAATAQDVGNDLTEGRADTATTAIDRTVTSRSADRHGPCPCAES